MPDPSRGEGPRLLWIGLRTAHRGLIQVAREAMGVAGLGLDGDHATHDRSPQRQLTLITTDDLGVISSHLGRPVEPMLLRRNLLVECRGAPLSRGVSYRLGDMVFLVTGPCEPCSRIREALGPDGLNAMRGHGGVTAKIIRGGKLSLGEPLIQLQYDLFQ